MTVVLKVFGSFYKFNIRLYGIDACEMKGENKELGIRAKNRLLQWLGVLDKKADLNVNYSNPFIRQSLEKKVCMVWIECGDFDKYGRLLALVYDKPNGESCAHMLLKEKYAYPYYGGTKMTEKEQKNYMKQL